MKTHTIKTPTAELMIAELEKGARKTAAFIVDVNGDPILDNYTLLGLPDEIREEDAELLVEKSPFNPYCYKQYKPITFHNEKWFLTATESLLSLLESEIYWDVNPLGNDDGTDGEGYVEDKIMHTEWHEAESRTFNKSRTLIFVKN